jgi:nitrite reductase/ring-hydroxylating ferredoxin subunit
MALMNDWVRVGTRSELLPGEYRVVWDGDTAIAVYNIDGDLYAIEDVCTHDGGELAGGPVVGFEVECVRHGARFDLRSGGVTCPPAYEPVQVFPVKEAEGAIWTRDDR